MASKKKLKRKLREAKQYSEWLEFEVEDLKVSLVESKLVANRVQQVTLTQYDGTPGKTVLYYFDPETGQQYPIKVNH